MAVRIDRDGTIIRDQQNRSNRNRRIAPSPVRHTPAILIVIFYIITIILSAIVSLLLSGLADGAVSVLIFLAGIAGCIFFNTVFADSYNFGEACLSVFSALAAILIVGALACLVIFVLFPLLKIVLIIAVILIVIILISKT